MADKATTQFNQTLDPSSPTSGVASTAVPADCSTQGLLAPPEHYNCPYCDRSLSSRIGLGVHKKIAHAAQTNLENKPNFKKKRWTDEDSFLLARREAELSLAGHEFLNQALDGFLPGRSFDAIKSHRKGKRYQELVKSIIATGETESGSTPVSPHSSSAASSKKTRRKGRQYQKLIASVLDSETQPSGPDRHVADNPSDEETSDSLFNAHAAQVEQVDPTPSPQESTRNNNSRQKWSGRLRKSRPVTDSGEPNTPQSPASSAESQYKDIRSYKVWSEEESRKLAKGEIMLLRVGKATQINKELHYFFPQRTLESIRNHRKTKAYKDLVENLKVADRPGGSDTSLNTTSSDVDRQGTELPHDESFHADQQGNLPAADPVTTDDLNPCNESEAGINHPAPKENAVISGYLRKLLDSSERNTLDNCGLSDVIISALQGDNVQTPLDEIIDRMFPTKLPERKSKYRETTRQFPNRKKRRMDFAKHQDLFRKDRKKCASLIFDGPSSTDSFSSAAFAEAWSPIYTQATGHLPNLKEDEPHEPCEIIWEPVTNREILNAFPRRTTSPGPDGVTAADVRSVPIVILCALFNLFMLLEHLPSRLNESRTIFIAKTDTPDGPLDFRPISITSTITRTFHKIIANRLRDHLPWNPIQRAFIKADGCGENTSILMTVFQDAYNRRRNLHMASLDVKKAFDSVSHQAVLHAFRRLGCPKGFINYLKNTQLSAKTTFQGTDGPSDPLSVTCGVRQGDPISPFAFNAVIDELLSVLPPEIGFDFGGCLVNSLAFADDLNLLASSEAGLQSLLDTTADFLRARNLEINPKKSHTVSLIPSGKKKKIFIDPVSKFSIRNIPIPANDINSTWKYLGVKFTARGHIVPDISTLNPLLLKLKKAPLKPQQRLYLLRFHLLPRFIHNLTLSEPNVGCLKYFDKTVRNFIRESLRLPHDLANAFFHAATKDGGLGIPSFRMTIPRLQIQRISSMQDSPVPLLQAVADHQIIKKRLGKAKKWCTISGTAYVTKEEQISFWAESLHTSVDGHGLRNSRAVPEAHKWIYEGGPKLTGRDYIQALKIRFNALPTRARTSRGQASPKYCRAGCNTRETTSHVLQCCPRTHQPRVKRHDAIVKLFADRLKKKSWKVLLEPSYRTTEGLRKPDIVAYKNDLVYVLDAQVVSDSISLSEAHERKVSYYAQNKSLCNLLRLEFKCNNMIFSSITSNLRGILSPDSTRTLRGIGLNSYDLKIWSLRCIQGGIAGWTIFNKSTANHRAFQYGAA